MQNRVTMAFGSFISDESRRRGANGTITHIGRRSTILRAYPLYGDDDDSPHTEGDYLIWSAVPSFVNFIAVMMGSLPLMRARWLGIPDRLLRLGVSSGELLFVHFGIRLCISCVQNVLLHVAALLLVRDFYAKNWHFVGALGVMTAQSMCGFAFGVLIQSFFDQPMCFMMTVLVLELLTSAVAGELD